MSFEDVNFPPQGEGQKGRYESADLNIVELQDYLTHRNEFEDEADVVETLSRLYGMRRYSGENDIKWDMTRKFKGVTPEDLERLEKGIEQESDKGEPLSGVDPEEVAALPLVVKNGSGFMLRVFKIYNRNGVFRFGYVLES